MQFIRKGEHVKDRSKDIRGHCFDQESLEIDLTGAVAGQKKLTKSILTLLIGFLWIFVGAITGALGGLIYLNIFTAGKGASVSLEWLLMFFIIVIGIVTATYQNFSKTLWVVIGSTVLLVTISGFLEALNLLPNAFQPSDTLLLTVLTTCAAVFFGFSSSIASFFTLRYTVALSDILHGKFLFLKSLRIPLIIFSAWAGSIVATKDPNVGKVLLSLPDAVFMRLKMGAVIAGVFFSLAIALAAWLADRRQGVPWTHPNQIRSFVLTIGSWRGTSFRHLDLSHVDFSHAQLANTDLRARKLYHTCFQGVTGLDRAKVDSQYLDLEIPKVQRLLIYGCSQNFDFHGFNLQGAYLLGADMRGFDLSNANLTGAYLRNTDLRKSHFSYARLIAADLQNSDARGSVMVDVNLTGADCRGADLRGTLLVRAQVADVDFTGADLTGTCIEDWSVNSKTCLTNVRCDYIYKKYEQGQASHRYPQDRNFESEEFAFLFQEPENTLELVFKGEFNFQALSLVFYKLQVEESDLDLKLKGIQHRGNLWVVTITSNNPDIEHEIEQKLNVIAQNIAGEPLIELELKRSIYQDYEAMKKRLLDSEQLIRQLVGITEKEAEALKELSKQPFGQNFYITGSTITNLAGSGRIDYNEAAQQVRNIVSSGHNLNQAISVSQRLLAQLQQQNVAMTVGQQIELITQIILSEAQVDPSLSQALMQQEQQLTIAKQEGILLTAIRAAIAQIS